MVRTDQERTYVLFLQAVSTLVLVAGIFCCGSLASDSAKKELSKQYRKENERRALDA